MYKVIQDIEAEDKFVGPLTLKQFVFAMAGSLFGYLSFFLVTKGLSLGLIVTMPPCFFSFFMAFPWSREQPTDVWVLAKLRFRLKPKVRIWNQAGIQELVTITAPKKEEKILTNNLSETEVKSRLQALAETIDSRGWAIKHASLEEAYGPSDRLIDPAILPQEVPEYETDIPDMLERTEVDGLLQKDSEKRKAHLYEKMDKIREGQSLDGLDSPEPMIEPPLENFLDEEALSAQIKAKRTAGDIGRNNMHAIPATQPLVATQPQQDDEDTDLSQKTEVKKTVSKMTEQRSPDILDLALNNDLSVSTIAREANNKAQQNDDEVVISLH